MVKYKLIKIQNGGQTKIYNIDEKIGGIIGRAEDELEGESEDEGGSVGFEDECRSVGFEDEDRYEINNLIQLTILPMFIKIIFNKPFDENVHNCNLINVSQNKTYTINGALEFIYYIDTS